MASLNAFVYLLVSICNLLFHLAFSSAASVEIVLFQHSVCSMDLLDGGGQALWHGHELLDPALAGCEPVDPQSPFQLQLLCGPRILCPILSQHHVTTMPYLWLVARTLVFLLRVESSFAFLWEWETIT